MAGVRPKCLVDHLTVVKQTAETFPKSRVSVIQLMSTVARTNIDKSRETLEYILETVSSIEMEKQNIVFKEVSLILQKFPSLLNSNFINRLSKFEDSTSVAAKGIIEDIKNEYNMQRIDKPQEKQENMFNKVQDVTSRGREMSGVTIVKVGGSKPDVSRDTRLECAAPRDVTTRKSSENIPVSRASSSSAHHILSSAPVKHVSAVPGSEITVHSDQTQLGGSKDGSRSTGKLPTHRSMTRLNMNTSAGRLESRQVHKSMTKLDHRYSSHNTVLPPVVINTRSHITNSSFRPPSLSTYTKISGSTGSPTKSMSSGSMSGLTERERDMIGREVVTVDKQFINQIHTGKISIFLLVDTNNTLL